MSAWNSKQVAEIAKKIPALWPNKFEPAQVVILVDELKKLSFEVVKDALRMCAVEPGFIGIGEIAARAKSIAQERARTEKLSRKENPGCGECNSGWIFALDGAGYEFTFQCKCSYDSGRPVPMWDSSIAGRGFRKKPTRSLSGPRLWERKSQQVNCGKCGHHIGNAERIKINYTTDGVKK